MSNQKAPGGLSWTDFKVMSLEAGEWLWGTAQGAFNQKADLSQIIVDAVIGMIPLVGDVTAVRDLIAVSIGLSEDPKKREDTWEWVLLIVLLFALIPVIGGVIKGVGRLLIRSIRLGEPTAKIAVEITQFLNRIGHGNAEKWLKNLKFSDYQAQIISKLDEFVYLINGTLLKIKQRVGKFLSESMLKRIDALQTGFNKLRETAKSQIPAGIKLLDAKLLEIQTYIRSGGETTSRTTRHSVPSGHKALTYADEARLMEDGVLPVRSRRGGWQQNSASAHPGNASRISKYYQHHPDYPNLKKRQEKDSYPYLAAFAGKITNRQLKSGEQIFRVFGPEGITHGAKVDRSFAGGAWWGLGSPPKNAKEWRLSAAVKDEWNRDGFIVSGTVPTNADIKACTGIISEQFGKEIPGQYLPGGGQQAFTEWSMDQGVALQAVADQVIKTKTPAKWKDSVTGIEFEIRPTGWTDANGIHGYISMPGPTTVQTSKLGARERSSKDDRQTAR